MGLLSIFKIGTWLLAGIIGFFAVKKIAGSRRRNQSRASAKTVEVQQSKEREISKEKSKSYERYTTQEVTEERYEQSQSSGKSKSNSDDSETRRELRSLISKVSELIGRGFDQSQIGRSLASSGKSVPKHELAPLIDALQRFLSGYDDKSVKAQEKYSLKAQNDHKAIADLQKGNPEVAISILERKLSQLEGAAASMNNDGLKADALAQAAEIARHLAVLSAAVNAGSSYNFAQKSVDLNGYDIKSLDLLGYYELSYDNLDGASKHFSQALALDNSGTDKVWIELAQEGLEMVESKKGDTSFVKGPEKAKTSINMQNIAKAFDHGHERVE